MVNCLDKFNVSKFPFLRQFAVANLMNIFWINCFSFCIRNREKSIINKSVHLNSCWLDCFDWKEKGKVIFVDITYCSIKVIIFISNTCVSFNILNRILREHPLQAIFFGVQRKTRKSIGKLASYILIIKFIPFSQENLLIHLFLLTACFLIDLHISVYLFTL